MFSTAKDDDMVECPYNKYHRMTRRRLQPHLIKCRVSYPDVELCKCPFNASHLVPEPEFTHHCTTCPDKALITQYKYNAVPLKIEEEDRKQLEVDCAENWDDTEAKDYDPKIYASQANVIRVHIGNLPSVRKEFRKNERKRLGDEESSDEDEIKSKKKIFLDYDCKAREELKESKWFEDRGPSSSSSNNSQRRDSYNESLKLWSRDRGLDVRHDQSIRPIKSEKSAKSERDEYSKHGREREYSLDDDPYYKSQNTSHQSGSAERGSYRYGRSNH